LFYFAKPMVAFRHFSGYIISQADVDFKQTIRTLPVRALKAQFGAGSQGSDSWRWALKYLNDMRFNQEKPVEFSWRLSDDKRGIIQTFKRRGTCSKGRHGDIQPVSYH
jgi:hypothetical protein